MSDSRFLLFSPEKGEMGSTAKGGRRGRRRAGVKTSGTGPSLGGFFFSRRRHVPTSRPKKIDVDRQNGEEPRGTAEKGERGVLVSKKTSALSRSRKRSQRQSSILHHLFETSRPRERRRIKVSTSAAEIRRRGRHRTASERMSGRSYEAQRLVRKKDAWEPRKRERRWSRRGASL